jgi:hypothetical protein
MKMKRAVGNAEEVNHYMKLLLSVILVLKNK